jgi:hypothetical protein
MAILCRCEIFLKLSVLLTRRPSDRDVVVSEHFSWEKFRIRELTGREVSSSKLFASHRPTDKSRSQRRDDQLTMSRGRVNNQRWLSGCDFERRKPPPGRVQMESGGRSQRDAKRSGLSIALFEREWVRTRQCFSNRGTTLEHEKRAWVELT